MNKKQKFYFRGFVSFFLFFTFIIVAVTGLILYVTPPGRIARWTAWTLMGLSKDQLEGIHTIGSFAFTIAAAFHVFMYNRRPLWHYIKKQSAKLKSVRKYLKECIVAVVLTTILVAGCIVPFPPFSTFIQVGDELKKSWGDKSHEAPVPEAHKLPLTVFAQKVLRNDVQQAIQTLTANGIKVKDKNQKLIDIAKTNDCSPEELYQYLKPIQNKIP